MPLPLQPQIPTSSASPLLEDYERCLQEGKLQNDEAQRSVIEKLENLRVALTSVQPPPATGLWRKFFTPAHDEQPIRSLYIWGDVGRGKSLLMNMFFKHAPVIHKRRVHFHTFMLDIHAGAHAFRQKHTEENPVTHVAEAMASMHQLLCLDEFQVTDVADAMILDKLFRTQLDKGVTFVITSNRPPEDLYKGGLQREKFLAFVELVRTRMDIVELASDHDYRMRQIRAMQSVYFWPRDEQSDKSLRDTFRQLTHNAERAGITLEVLGRKLEVNECYGSIAMFTFHELCETPLGSADYLAIAQHFSVILLSGIPRLSNDKRNEARRFVTLIDTLYDHHVKLICTADAPPDKLYPAGDGVFEFQRTASRLAEMQSEDYLSSIHIP